LEILKDDRVFNNAGKGQESGWRQILFSFLGAKSRPWSRGADKKKPRYNGEASH
jgi:hypothetical protein